MKTDRELLELAARAAGNVQGMYMGWNEAGRKQFGITTATGMRWWNPLRDDGDALRLAVRLKMHIFIDDDDWTMADTETENHDSDPYAATRRAIVRAAAAIGEGMK